MTGTLIYIDTLWPQVLGPYARVPFHKQRGMEVCEVNTSKTSMNVSIALTLPARTDGISNERTKSQLSMGG